MQHSYSILFGPLNKLMAFLFGPASGAPAWWRDGVTIGGFHIAGGAVREGGHVVAWLPDHVCMALLVFAICVIVFPLMKRSYRRDAPEAAQNVLEVFLDFLRDVVKENIEHHRAKYLPIVGGFFFFILIGNAFGWFFFLQPPTANLNTTFALTISCFLFFNAAGIRAHGLFGYLKHFNFDRDFDHPFETVTYSLNGTRLEHTNHLGTETLVQDVSDFSFTYFDANGNVLSQPINLPEIRSIGVSITLTSQAGRGEDVLRNYSTRIRCRNL